MKRNCYIVVAEGSSEYQYLQRLNSFLARDLSSPDDDMPRLIFSARPKNGGVGGGKFSLVKKAYRNAKRENAKAEIIIVVDLDIYIRGGTAQEKRNANEYAAKKDIPDFHFSVMNFEDFLALHFDDEAFDWWYDTFDTAGHFVRPLVSAEYGKKFAPIWESVYGSKYRKGEIPSDFITKKALSNLIRHVKDKRILELFNATAGTETFAQLVVRELEEKCEGLLDSE